MLIFWYRCATSYEHQIETKYEKFNGREAVGASDYLPCNIWVRMSMDAQGYKIRENVYHQDNMSAMKLGKNGRMS